MFVKTRNAHVDGWIIYTGIQEIHTERLAFDTFDEHAGICFDHDSYDVRWNINVPPDEERAAIDEHESRQHGFVVIMVRFEDGRSPMKLFTNTVSYLCNDDGSTAQVLG